MGYLEGTVPRKNNIKKKLYLEKAWFQKGVPNGSLFLPFKFREEKKFCFFESCEEKKMIIC